MKSSSNSIILRIELDQKVTTFGEMANVVSLAGGDIVAIDVIRSDKQSTTRDITVNLGEQAVGLMTDKIRLLPGVVLHHISDPIFLVHLGGKIEIQPKIPVKNRDDLSKVYTPGVARVCMAIHEEPHKAFTLTIKRNTVAVISDGTAVLGLGDIGPEAAMPVMEGKAMLFKQLAGVDAVPICLDTKDTEDIIRTIKNIAPAFGGINLEDISSPRCFEIESRLKEELDIPVFHDDQHGTAVVVLAGIINALRLTKKRMEDIRIVVVGIGAAGVSIIKMLLGAGAIDIVAVDRQGILTRGISYDNSLWDWVALHTNPEGLTGSLSDALIGADVFIGVSGPNVLKVEDVCRMASDPIVFAMANPTPEIDPEVAGPHVRVIATGRSDFPNQINNVLCFPGIFRGALDCRASEINEEMKLAASRAIALTVSDEELNEQYIIPSIFNEKVVQEIRDQVIWAAIQSGVARRIPPEFKVSKQLSQISTN
ncbi:malate dehydrogenase (oxaloacetate-decarboxylating) [Paenibacillus sp. yr247]|uniref:NAD-dependent malic enzyme n=1 Tax=Paenibacillus sp. yr247 TaxID=1761880 RepID=UPI00087F3E17|nr:NAD-dependent malic enzyme [Paenibacillus sp. yr247]SDO24392.1 malate dehydrogenase (oxaloacetate-decarboxylating) [Paenibacillus sp. yr247]